MGLFDRIFKKRKKFNIRASRDLSMFRHYLDSLKIPGLMLTAGTKKSFSRIGGLPVLPEGTAWPQWKGKPQSFLCQIDCAELPETDGLPAFPSTGVLSFFYDQDQQPWGFDPSDRGSWKVLYSERMYSLVELPRPDDLEDEGFFQEQYISFSPISTYPDWQDERIESLGMSDAQEDGYIEFCLAAYEDAPKHQLFGYPVPEQGNDMDLECQLVTNGLYRGNPSGYDDSKAKELEKGREDWLLLLQIDTDDAAGMMWGDAGKLYFWIKWQDLANRNFDNVWMILQCG